MNENLKDKVARLCQTCASDNPIVVLGSGASIPHGIKSMCGLTAWLLENIVPSGENEEDAWLLVKTALNEGDHLEAALEKNTLSESLLRKVIRSTWDCIASDDYKLMKSTIDNNESFPLTTLLSGLFRSTNRNIQIITTNYDRVAEYAVDTAGFIHHTGFMPGYLRRTEGAENLYYKQGSRQARTVTLWKVHGSIDWFLDKSNNVISLPLTSDLPDNLVPLIVTPGVSKFQRTHDEPFRSAIQGADHSLKNSGGIICIGYGFRDSHIHPKIITRCSAHNVPILVAARTLTLEAREFLRKDAGKHYIALEDHSEGTMTYSSDCPDGELLKEEKLWELAVLNSLIGF